MGSYTETDVVTRVWMTLRDYGQTATQQLLTDTEVTTLGTRGAEPIYSRVRPRQVIADLTADGTNYLALPAGFIDGFSTLALVESPPDKVPASIIDPRDYYVGRSGSGALRIVFVNVVPGNGDTVRIAYGAQRVMAAVAGNTTVLDSDFTAFCDLASSICADAIAAKFARTSEPVINADAVNYRSRTQEWRDIAKRLWDRFEMAMGGADPAAPASAWANWDMRASWGAYRFSHNRFNR